jgi:hypothetical protein
MARISTYAIDAVVTLLDKWIGTDSNSGNATKNFTAQSIADLFNANGSIGIVNQNNFQFQTNLVGGRKPGTVSFTAGGGGGTSLASLTTIKISKFAASTNLILDYIETLVGEYVMLAQIDDLNNFGIYKLDSLTQDVTETDFYNANFTFIGSNGNLDSEKYYGLIIYPGGSAEAEGDKNFVFTQASASATWNVQHNLNKFPSCTMVLSTGQQGYGDVTFIDENNLTITFASAESGKAYMN